MQRVKFGRDLMDLEADMICLKRQLTMILDENHVLKVKIRRLENDITKKNKYIDYLHLNAQKTHDSRRITYENASGTIMKLKRQNEDLREMLLKREVEDQKRSRTKKTVLLYRQLDHKLLRKPLRKSNRHFKSQTSFDQTINNSKRLSSVSDSNTLSKEYYRSPRKNFYTKEVTNDHYKLSNISQVDTGELMGMINILKQQRALDRSIIHAKNSDISRLTAELNETKAQLKLESFKPSSSCLLLGSGVSGARKNFVDNKIILTKSAEFDSHKNSYRDAELNISAMERKKTILEPVQELSEDEIFISNSDRSETNFYRSNITRMTKTPIEYVIDSEVSSDGEDIYIAKNFRNYHKKTIGTMA